MINFPQKILLSAAIVAFTVPSYGSDKSHEYEMYLYIKRLIMEINKNTSGLILNGNNILAYA